MSGGAPIQCPRDTCDWGYLEDFSPVKIWSPDREDVDLGDDGYIGWCAQCRNPAKVDVPVVLNEDDIVYAGATP